MSSLTRLAIRTCAIEAIRNNTIAEDRVFDSAVTSFDKVISTENAKPIIVITTDDTTAAIQGRDLHGAEVAIDVVIEIAIAKKIELPDNDGGAVTIPGTDAGLELLLDILSDQIEIALLSGSDWGNLFKNFTPRWTNILSRRGASTKEGNRFAARQIILTVDSIARPDLGQDTVAPGLPWGKFLALAKASPELDEVAKVVEKQILGTSITSFNRLVQVLGITVEGSKSIGLEPFLDDEGNEAGFGEEIIVETDQDLLNDGRPLDADDLIINEETSNEQDPGGSS